MRKINKVFICLILIATMFLGIGYSAIQNVSLNIEGELIAKVPNDVLIVDAKLIESKNIDEQNTKILNIYKTMIQTKIVLSAETTDSYAKYEIKLHNNTDINYYFVETNTEGLYTNNDIKFER